VKLRRKMRIRKMASLLSGGMLAAGLSIGLTGAAQASTGAAQASTGAAQASSGAAQASSGPTDPSPFWNEITAPFENANSFDLCVDVTDGSTSPGTPLQLFHCHGYASNGGPQRWHFTPEGSVTGGNFYKIWNTNSGLCIGFANNSFVSGTRLVQEDCNQAPGWEEHVLIANGTSPFIELLNVEGNLCMAAANDSSANHTPLVATTCHNFGAQILELG
jgi:hypothetical protein